MSAPTGALTTVWTPDTIRQLGMTTDVATAARGGPVSEMDGEL
jgi:hypothetical protein